jgi:hypothetical protein
MSTNSRKKERKKEQKAAFMDEFLSSSAPIINGVPTIPLSRLSEIYPAEYVAPLYGVLLGQQTPSTSSGPRTVIHDRGLSLDEELALLDAVFEKRPTKINYYTDYILSNQAFHTIEQNQRSKHGPYREAKWSQMKPLLSNYYGLSQNKLKSLWQSGRLDKFLEQVSKELIDANDGTLVPASLDDAYQAIPKNTFYGAPYFTSKWQEIDGAVEWTLDMVRKLNDLDPEAITSYMEAPWVVFNRVVPNGPKTNKVRITMAPSKFGSLFEKQFTMPVLSSIANTIWGSGYKGNHICGPYIRHAVRKHDVAFSMDYEKFDQHCGSIARHIVKKVLQNAFGLNYDRQLEVIFSSFDNPLVVTPEGIVNNTEQRVDFGLGSGTGPTGIIGTIWNRICFLYLQERALDEFSIDIGVHFGYGDDTLLCWNGDDIPLKWFADRLAELGMSINLDKQEYSRGANRYASFLAKQYYYCNGVVSPGVYSAYRGYTRLLHKDVQKKQEDKWVAAVSKGLSKTGCDMLDTIALLEEMKDHPYHYDIVELIRDGHPMKLKSSLYIRNDGVGDSLEKEGQGLIRFKTVQIIRDWESKGIGLTGDEEENWTRHVLHKFCSSTFRSKGVNLTLAQAINWLDTGEVNWTAEQLKVITAFGQFRHTPLSERVRELEIRKGVILSDAQISQLRSGSKIIWSNDQVTAMSKFGGLSDTQKKVWQTEVSKLRSVRPVMDNGSKFEFDVLWHKVKEVKFNKAH